MKRLEILCAFIIIILFFLASLSCTSGDKGEASDPLFVAIGMSDIITSTDGDTWLPAASMPQFSSGLRDVAYDGSGRWIAVGGSAGVVMHTSTDGLNWVDVDDTATNSDLWGVAYGNGLWVTGDMFTGDIIHSADGETWTIASSVPPGINQVRGFCYANGLWVGVGAGTDSIIKSDDGDVWVTASSVPSGF